MNYMSHRSPLHRRLAVPFRLGLALAAAVSLGACGSDGDSTASGSDDITSSGVVRIGLKKAFSDGTVAVDLDRSRC